MKKLALIMLAAGNSRRFGSNKLLYPVDGVPMYLRILDTLEEVKRRIDENEEVSFTSKGREDGKTKEECDGITASEGLLKDVDCQITVVTQYEEIRREAEKRGIRAFLNPHPEDGISSSLQIGLQENLSADACLFTVSDQPWLKAETILRLLKYFLESDRGIACLSSGGQPGNPCVFSRTYYPELLALSGDKGGKRVILGHMDDTVLLEIEESWELTDLDVKPVH